MKLKLIVEKSDKELASLITASHSDLAKLIIDMRTKQIKNVKQVAAIKRTIARAMTITRERELTRLEQTNE